MTKERVMKPKLLNQVSTQISDSLKREDSILLRSNISKKNISRFFVHVYQSLYGGKILSDPWGSYFSHTPHSFNPDIERIEDGKRVSTEVKVTSTNSSKVTVSLKQTSNNLFEILRQSDEKDNSIGQLEYAFFKYGPSRLNGLSHMNNSKLVETLSKSEKSLIISPLNLTLYLLSFSRFEERDQTTSQYGRNSQHYHVIAGSLLTELAQGSFLEKIKDSYFSRILGIDNLKMEKNLSPPLKASYRKFSSIEPFPVTRYFLPENKYPSIVNSLRENHSEITNALRIRDLYQEGVENPVPF